MTEHTRWNDYCLVRSSDLDEMLNAAGTASGLHLVIGDGFDPRALHILDKTLSLSLSIRITTISLPPGSGTGYTTILAQENRQRFNQVTSTHGIAVHREPTPEGADRLTAGVRIARNLIEQSVVRPDEAIVLDVSALPSSRFFPLLGAFSQLVTDGGSGELIVTVAENPDVDDQVNPRGTRDPGCISGFNHGFRLDDSNVMRIWAPVLGKATSSELKAIYEYLTPVEVYPILPFPARDPRRADDLVLEHLELLLERFETTTRNFLYVQEANPFDCYRVLSGLYTRSTELLRPIGPVQVISSIHASKMLSIGVCLASIEQSIPIVTASGTHHLDIRPDVDLVTGQTELVGMWLAGTPYRK